MSIANNFEVFTAKIITPASHKFLSYLCEIEHFGNYYSNGDKIDFMAGIGNEFLISKTHNWRLSHSPSEMTYVAAFSSSSFIRINQIF